jgi:hypothetical protein
VPPAVGEASFAKKNVKLTSFYLYDRPHIRTTNVALVCSAQHSSISIYFKICAPFAIQLSGRFAMHIKKMFVIALGLSIICSLKSYAVPPVSAQLKDPRAADVTVVVMCWNRKRLQPKTFWRRLPCPKDLKLMYLHKT